MAIITSMLKSLMLAGLTRCGVEVIIIEIVGLAVHWFMLTLSVVAQLTVLSVVDWLARDGLFEMNR